MFRPFRRQSAGWETPIFFRILLIFADPAFLFHGHSLPFSAVPGNRESSFAVETQFMFRDPTPDFAFFIKPIKASIGFFKSARRQPPKASKARFAVEQRGEPFRACEENHFQFRKQSGLEWNDEPALSAFPEYYRTAPTWAVKRSAVLEKPGASEVRENDCLAGPAWSSA